MGSERKVCRENLRSACTIVRFQRLELDQPAQRGESGNVWNGGQHFHCAPPKSRSKSWRRVSRPATIVRPQWINPVGVSFHVASTPYKRYASHKTAPSDQADPSDSCARIVGVYGANHWPIVFGSSHLWIARESVSSVAGHFARESAGIMLNHTA